MKKLKVKVIRATVIDGVDCFRNDEVELGEKLAKELVRLGKVCYVEDMQDISIDVDIYSMKKTDLLKYASSLGLDFAKSATKDEIINLIEEKELEE